MAEDELNRLLADVRRHFDVTAERMEKRFDLLSEAVAHVSGEVRKTRTDLESAVERTAAETQAMIRFSHAELDRRVRALEDGQRLLEDTVASLRSRLDRLEAGTH